ncbi:hypothetical protein BCR33DRAFT_718836, partial [Rhizoclosmatium globosum]
MSFYIFKYVLVGFCCESSIKGLSTTHHLRREKSPIFLMMMLTAFNVFAIINQILIMFMWTNTESGYGCVYGTWFENLAWNLYFVIADAYILIKANTVAKNNKVYSVFAVGSFLYRIGWTIPDLVWVRGVWNADEKLCEYFSSPLSGLNCAVADILCDIVASFLVLAVFLQKKRLDPEATGVTLWQLLLKENMIRSILALVVNSFILWANLHVDDINILFIFYGLQNYTYIQLMNLELYWKR